MNKRIIIGVVSVLVIYLFTSLLDYFDDYFIPSGGKVIELKVKDVYSTKGISFLREKTFYGSEGDYYNNKYLVEVEYPSFDEYRPYPLRITISRSMYKELKENEAIGKFIKAVYIKNQNGIYEYTLGNLNSETRKLYIVD